MRNVASNVQGRCGGQRDGMYKLERILVEKEKAKLVLASEIAMAPKKSIGQSARESVS